MCWHHVAGEGAVVAVNGLMGYLLADGEKPPAAPAAAAPGPREAAPGPGPGPPCPGPRPRGGRSRRRPGRAASRQSWAWTSRRVTPTGPRGRVVEADVRGFAESAPAPGSGGGSTASLAGLPRARQGGGDGGHAPGDSRPHARPRSSRPPSSPSHSRSRSPSFRDGARSGRAANRAPVTNTHLYAKACAIVLAGDAGRSTRCWPTGGYTTSTASTSASPCRSTTG